MPVERLEVLALADEGPVSDLFTRGSNVTMRWGLRLLIASGVAVPIMLLAWVRTPWVTGQTDVFAQPVGFDHRHHAGDAGIDCRFCHSDVERARHAGLPATEVCMGCHAQIFVTSPALAPVRASFFLDRPIPWVAVNRLPDFVFFDHAAHVLRGVGCETCHGRVDRMPYVIQVESLTMGWCLDCHRNPGPRLRPPEAATRMGWTSDPLQPASLPAVDPPTHCYGCHR